MKHDSRRSGKKNELEADAHWLGSVNGATRDLGAKAIRISLAVYAALHGTDTGGFRSSTAKALPSLPATQRGSLTAMKKTCDRLHLKFVGPTTFTPLSAIPIHDDNMYDVMIFAPTTRLGSSDNFFTFSQAATVRIRCAPRVRASHRRITPETRAVSKETTKATWTQDKAISIASALPGIFFVEKSDVRLPASSKRPMTFARHRTQPEAGPQRSTSLDSGRFRGRTSMRMGIPSITNILRFRCRRALLRSTWVFIGPHKVGRKRREKLAPPRLSML